MTKQGLFTKHQLAQRYGLAAETIDHYVGKDLLQPVTLADGVFFSASAFLHIEIIEKGKRFGFSLSEIKQLIDSMKNRKPPV